MLRRTGYLHNLRYIYFCSFYLRSLRYNGVQHFGGLIIFESTRFSIFLCPMAFVAYEFESDGLSHRYNLLLILSQMKNSNQILKKIIKTKQNQKPIINQYSRTCQFSRKYICKQASSINKLPIPIIKQLQNNKTK